MTATASATIDGTAASSGRLSSVASGVMEFIWPMYLTLVFTLGAWVLIPTLVLGWQPVTIISGSMAPTVQPGHVVVVEPYADQEISEGTVLTYRDAELDRLVTHRVTAVDADGTITTRGDANAVDDPQPLTTDRIVGIGRLVIPAAGLPSLWAHEGRTDLLAVVVVLTALATASAASAASNGARALGRRSSLRRGTRDRRRVRTVGLATGVVALLAVLGATTVSRATFVGADENTANSFSAGTVGTPSGLTASADCVVLLSLVTGPAVDLAWTGVAEATGYEILRTKSDGSEPATLHASGTSFRDEGVSTGTSYLYSVRAEAGSWTGASSDVVSVTTPSFCLL